jgi:hypothetical protein
MSGDVAGSVAMASLGICGLPPELPREPPDKTPRMFAVKKAKQKEEKEMVGASFHWRSL